MTVDIRGSLKAIETGTREEIWEAAKQLESLAAEIVLSLIRLLENAECADTRAAAAHVLGLGRYASARTSLEQVLRNVEEEASVRGHAAEVLAYIQNKESVDVLLNQLGDADPGVKYWCIFALGQIADAKAVPALKRLSESIADQFYEKHSLRNEALDALAEIDNRLNDAVSD